MRDKLEAGGQPAVVRWNMVTPATVKVVGPGTAQLTRDGKVLTLRVIEPAGVVIRTWSTVPTHRYDSPNPGSSMVGFEAPLAAGAR